jgi:hypothetical protein
MQESPTNEVVVSYSRCRRSSLLFTSVSSLVVLLLPTLLDAVISSLSRALRAQAAPPKQERLIQDGFHGMYLEEKEAQTETRDAGDVRNTKSINLCSRAQKKDKYALGIHGECASKATTLIS